MEQTDKLVKRAYELYKENKDNDRDKLALDTLTSLHRRIERWDGNIPGLGFTQNYLVGPHMEAIASSGACAARVDIFKSLMKKPSTLEKIRGLFAIRKSGPVEAGIINQVTEVDLIHHVIEHPNLIGNRPRSYIQRFLLCIFIEIMTTIADEGHLQRTARILGKNPVGVSFARLQVQIRSMVDESLDRQGIGSELNLFTRATIAYFIEKASEDLNG